jgi:S-adenosylmethionine:tRNA ribosyltransferase-isomerase
MKVTNFDFHLPRSLIAQTPAFPRDRCRLLILHRNGEIVHLGFPDLPTYLSEGDLLLLNNTKVFPARLLGRKETGGKIEMLLVRETEPQVWEILSKGGYTGPVLISDALSGDMERGRILRLRRNGSSDSMEEIWKTGLMPLPPYVRREPDPADREWYQTVYAEKTGSIAAPTAGLHFTKELLQHIESKGVLIRFITLHVGAGTFRPVRGGDVETHCMDEERFEMQTGVIETIRKVKAAGKRVISVGTTTTRAIEGYASGRWSAAGCRDSNNASPEWGREWIRGTTDIFIRPGYRFRAVDSLITNFHLPRSTPLMLTSALCGIQNLMEAYRSAIRRGYRFFSYGDAMLIL